MSNTSLKPRTYSELYDCWRDHVITIIGKHLENYIEDDYLEQMVMTEVGDQVVPQDADYAWINGIVVSKPEMLTEDLYAAGSTLQTFARDTIRCKVVRDLLNEFGPTFERLREAHRTGSVGPR